MIEERKSIICDDCGKVLFRPLVSELGSPEIVKRIADVQEYHDKNICWKKQALKKASKTYYMRKTTY